MVNTSLKMTSVSLKESTKYDQPLYFTQFLEVQLCFLLYNVSHSSKVNLVRFGNRTESLTD